jgi:VanZ family protein
VSRSEKRFRSNDRKARIQRSLENAGVIFIAADQVGGPGVRLRENSRDSQAVAAGLGTIAAPLLEALQSFEPTHSANFLSVISGAGGAFAALVISAIASIAGRRAKGREDQH